MSHDTELEKPETELSGVETRPLRSWEEYRAAEDLQREVWGEDFSELAPASLLKIGQRLGGVSSGAFHPEEGLVGFVFGLTGLEDGEPVHWSHMLAVRAGFRGRGLGLRLKEHQRELLLSRGVRTVYWTFDPLVARNAHFNLNRLGARVVDYVPRMYGETGSPLHQGLDTDRFLVEWELEAYDPGAPSAAPTEGAPRTDAGEAGDLPAGQAPPAEMDLAREDGPSTPPAVRVEIPSDIHAVREEDPEEAARWRERTRQAFVARLEGGYRVAGFVPGPERGFYLLVRQDVGGADGGG